MKKTNIHQSADQQSLRKLSEQFINGNGTDIYRKIKTKKKSPTKRARREKKNAPPPNSSNPRPIQIHSKI